MSVTLGGLVLAALPIAATANTEGVGLVNSVVVARLGTQVMIGLGPGAQITGAWPCPDPASGYQDVFLLTQPGGNALYATVLGAQLAGKRIDVLGAGTCNQLSAQEDVNYITILSN